MTETNYQKKSLNDLYEERNKLIEEQHKLINSVQGYPEYDDFDESDYYPDYQISENSDKIESIEHQIGMINYNNKKVLYKQSYENNIKNYRRGSVISDITKDDLFDRRGKAKQLAQYIVEKRTIAPFNIGIFARWGEGKTTFLTYLQEEIEVQNRNFENKKHENYKTFVVNYDSSEYEEKNKIWASILKAMFLKYEKSTWFPKIFYNYAKLASNKKQSITNLFSYAFSLILVCLLAFYSIYTMFDGFANQLQIITASSSIIISSIVFVTKLLVPAINGLLQSAVPLSEKIINNIALPNYIDKLGERETFKNDLVVLTKAWLNRFGKKNSRLVLIVDELDRCSEKGIVEFFQSMQLLLKVPQLIIVFAIDEEHLKDSLKSNFDIQEKSKMEEFLIEYLDKYINLPYSLDSRLNYEEYIDYLLKTSKRGNSLYAISKGEQEKIQFAIRNIPSALLTPRKIKKLLNILILSKEVCVIFNQQCTDETEIIDFRGYILWFFFSYFNKSASNYFTIFFGRNSEYRTIDEIVNKMSQEERVYLQQLATEASLGLIKNLNIKDISTYQYVLDGFAKIL